MNDMSSAPTAAEDAAWASINTPLTPDELFSFCCDIERLFRINPLLEFKSWQKLSDDQYRISGKNLSQETPFEFEFGINVVREEAQIRLNYDTGIKSSTTLKIEASPIGSTLTLTDSYDRLPVEDREKHIDQVDKSLVVWAKYLQQFLVNWKRWSKIGLWRWYMRRIWQPMKPTARRITYMLIWISIVEVALIALGAAIYFVEYT